MQPQNWSLTWTPRSGVSWLCCFGNCIVRGGHSPWRLVTRGVYKVFYRSREPSPQKTIVLGMPSMTGEYSICSPAPWPDKSGYPESLNIIDLNMALWNVLTSLCKLFLLGTKIQPLSHRWPSVTSCHWSHTFFCHFHQEPLKGTQGLSPVLLP